MSMGLKGMFEKSLDFFKFLYLSEYHMEKNMDVLY